MHNHVKPTQIYLNSQCPIEVFADFTFEGKTRIKRLQIAKRRSLFVDYWRESL